MVGLEEQRKKKHTAEEKEEGGWGYWEGAVACVLFAHTVVDADLEKRKNIIPENQIKIKIVLRLSSDFPQKNSQKHLKTYRVSASSREAFPLRCAPDIWNEPARTMNTNFVFHWKKFQLNSLILGGFLDKLRKIQILH